MDRSLFFLVECIGNEPTARGLSISPIDHGGGDVPMSTTNCCCQPIRRLFFFLFNPNKNPSPLDPSSNTADLFSITQLEEKRLRSLKGIYISWPFSMNFQIGIALLTGGLRNGQHAADGNLTNKRFDHFH